MATADSRRRRQTDEMRPHYDIRSLEGRVRGKYAARYAAGQNVVRLAPDVAAAFKTDTDVNAALRTFLLGSAGRSRRMMTAGQLLEALLADRVEAVVSTIEKARAPLTMAQICRKCPDAPPPTIRLLLHRCELEGRLRRERLRGADRWAPARG